MKLLLHDANVLIDLMSVGLLDITFRLPFVMETTDFVVREIVLKHQRDAIHELIQAGKLSVLTASSEMVVEIARLNREIPALTITDCSVLCQARFTGAIVLSGDGLVRKTAKAQALRVCGTLWIFQQLVSEGLMTPLVAIERMTELMARNARLPRSECFRLLEHWKANSG